MTTTVTTTTSDVPPAPAGGSEKPAVSLPATPAPPPQPTKVPLPEKTWEKKVVAPSKEADKTPKKKARPSKKKREAGRKAASAKDTGPAKGPSANPPDGNKGGPGPQQPPAGPPPGPPGGPGAPGGAPPAPTPPAPPAKTPSKLGYGVYVVPGGVEIEYNYLFTDEQKKQLALYMPGYIPLVGAGATAHPHPIANFERLVAEIVCYRECEKMSSRTEYIVDIGGNPNRHGKFKRKGCWSLNPTITPNDAVRNSLWTSNFWCQHKLQDACKCAAPVSVFMSIHSLYYLSCDEILEAVHSCSAKTLIAALHEFGSAAGTMCLGEVQYEVDGKGTVRSLTKGNSHTYEHDCCAWLKTGAYKSGGRAMAWSVHTRIGDTIIYRFSVAPINVAYHPPQMEVDYKRAVASVDYFGPIKKQRITAMGIVSDTVSVNDFERYPVFSMGASLIVGVDQDSCLIPKELISQVVASMAYKPRTSDTFQQCVSIVRSLSKRLDIPDKYLAGVTTHAPIICFSMIEFQERSMLAMLWDKATLFSNYNDAISFRTNWLKRFTGYLLPIGAMTTVACIAWWRNWANLQGRLQMVVAAMSPASWMNGQQLQSIVPDLVERVWDMIVRLTSNLGRRARKVMGACTRPCDKLRNDWEDVVLLMAAATLFGVIWMLRPARPRPGAVMAITHESYDDMCYAGTPLAPMDQASRISTPLNQLCRPQHGATACAIVFAQRMPIQPRSCCHNEEIGVRNRTIMDLYAFADKKTQQLEWSELENETEPAFHAEFMFSRDGWPQMPKFQEWLTRFPRARRKMFVEALEQQEVRYDQNYSASKAFIKRELLFKLDDQGTYDMSPRLIQGCHELYQVHTGPWTLAMTKHMSKIWSWPESRLVYTSGMTAEELGKAFDWACETILLEHGSLVIGENDASYWDGTQGKPAIRSQCRTYELYRPPAVTMSALRMQEETRGSTPHGVTYRAEARVKSGVGNTGCGNTLTNAKDHYHAFRKSALRHHPWLKDVPIRDQLRWVSKQVIMFLLGDDSIFFTHEGFIRVLEESMQFLVNLGLRPKFKVVRDLATAEYCSGYFWPSADGTVYGPKIGRLLMKNGWSRQREIEPLRWAKAVALGMRCDVAHIPILRDISEKVLELTEDIQARPYRETDRFEHKVHARVPHKQSAEVYDFMYRIYGITKDQVDKCQELIRSVKHLPSRITHEVFDAFFEVDIKPRGPTDTDYHIPPSNPPRPRPVYASWLAGLCPTKLVEVAKGAYTWLTTRSMQDYWMSLVLLAPFTEEPLKHAGKNEGKSRIGLIVTLLGMMWEWYVVYRSLHPLHALRLEQPAMPRVWVIATLMYLPTAILHMVTWWMPLKPAIITHLVYNVVILIHRLRATVPPASVISGVLKFPHTESMRSVDENLTEAVATRFPRRARQLVDRLLRGREITEKGLKFLTCATDPFHDTPLKPDGYPDESVAPTVVETLNATVSLTAPGSGTWEAHIFFLPLGPNMQQAPGGAYLGNYFAKYLVSYAGSLDNAPVTTYTQLFPGWNAIAVPTGTDWQVTQCTGVPDLCLPKESCRDNWRIIGTGCEVTNTTAELYKGGSVSTYRASSPPQDFLTSVATTLPTSEANRRDLTNIRYDIYPTKMVPLPPATVATAVKYPSSQTWLAKDGIYMVGTFNNEANRFMYPTPSVAGAYIPKSVADQNTGQDWNCWVPRALSAGVDTLGYYRTSCVKPLPFDTTGCIMYGLNPNTTLQIAVRYYIEHQPDYTNPTVLALSHQGCPHDPLVMEMLSRVMAHMPVGCHVDENPLGEWFDTIMQGFADYAPIAGAALNGVLPGAGALGTAVGTAAGMAKKFNASFRPQAESQLEAAPKQKVTPNPITHHPGATYTSAAARRRARRKLAEARKT